MFYQSNHSGFVEQCFVHITRGLNFPKHIHRNYELVLSLNEGMVVDIDGKEYMLNANDAVAIFSHQCHSYTANPSNVSIMFIFSPSVVPSFHKEVSGYLPENPVFNVSKELINAFPTLINPEKFTEDNSVFIYKSFLYAIGDLLLRNSKLVKKNRGSKDSLLGKMLSLIDESLTENGSLSVLAEKLNYDYTYLSKCFLKETGMSFSSYINGCRINLACELLQDDVERKCITEIALKSGYSSIRSFNDNFKKYTGISPREYMKRQHKE